jgi:hypothetical protein
MDLKAIIAVLSGLGPVSMTVACSPSRASGPSTEVATPDAHQAETAAEGEHACGNHAEGACGAASPDEHAATQNNFTIAPGKFAEANFKMAKGSTVLVEFDDGGSQMKWDVHSHDASGGTVIHAEGRGGPKVEFTAPSDGVFSVLWKNEGDGPATLDVSVKLGDGTGIHSWYPAES